MAMVTVRYWAAAKQAAGTGAETLDAATLAEALAGMMSRRAGDRDFEAVLARSSFLVDGEHVGAGAREAAALADGSVIEVLPPFAGG